MSGEPADEHDAGGRSMHLLGGRRVRVSDLLEAGLLKPGAKLRFHRNRVRKTYHATVTDKGRIRLEPEGEEFRTPSRAAMVASGMRAVDGWVVWRVVDQNRLLDAVRQELLDRAMSTVSAKTDRRFEDEKQQRIHARLRQARNRADAHDPERITVRDLLTLWDTTDRGEQVSQIEADLANHGLVTSPSFRAVTLDTMVALTTPADETEDAETPEPPEVDNGPVAEDDEGGGDLDVRLMLGNLSPLDGVEHISPNSSLDEAITKMLLNDFSQLAVLSGPRAVRGAVTWRSIAQAIHRKPDATVFDATVPAEVYAYDRDLFEILPTLQRHEFVFVRDETKTVAGIVTTADVAQRYGEMATPYFQVGELDLTLRWILARIVDVATIRRLCNKSITSFNDLTFGDYERVLGNREVWARLRWPLDRGTFISRLEEIRRVRNKVMHFHPDPVAADAVDKLRLFNSLLHRYRDQA